MRQVMKDSCPGDGARRAAEQTTGSPYLMQLIGHYIVLYADDSGSINASQLEQAISSAQDEYLDDVCSTAIAPLSNKDVAYLSAMAEIGAPCRTSAIASKMGVTPDFAQQYRKRLLDAGLIRAPRQGIVEFAVPLLADYLRKREGNA